MGTFPLTGLVETRWKLGGNPVEIRWKLGGNPVEKMPQYCHPGEHWEEIFKIFKNNDLRDIIM